MVRAETRHVISGPDTTDDDVIRRLGEKQSSFRSSIVELMLVTFSDHIRSVYKLPQLREDGK